MFSSNINFLLCQVSNIIGEITISPVNTVKIKFQLSARSNTLPLSRYVGSENTDLSSEDFRKNSIENEHLLSLAVILSLLQCPLVVSSYSSYTP